MPAYVIANIEVTDAERFKEYRRLAKLTLTQYGAKVLSISDAPAVLEGDGARAVVLLLRERCGPLRHGSVAGHVTPRRWRLTCPAARVVSRP